MAKRPRQRMENQLDWLIQSMTMMSKKMEVIEQRIDKIENIIAIDIPHPFTSKSNVYNQTAEPLRIEKKVSALPATGSELDWNSSLTFKENLQEILTSLREENQSWRSLSMDDLEAS
jgi:restriction endonuclease Mrr